MTESEASCLLTHIELTYPGEIAARVEKSKMVRTKAERGGFRVHLLLRSKARRAAAWTLAQWTSLELVWQWLQLPEDYREQEYLMKDYTLIIFDLYGTLTNTPFIDKQPLTLLSGRREKLAQLRQGYESRGLGNELAPRPIYAIAHNAGGVAFGILSEEDATAEVAGIAREIDTIIYEVSFGHPNPKPGFERYATDEMLSLRKPEPGMLNLIMSRLRVSPEETLMVGDLLEDFRAARAAGVDFMWARHFFAKGEVSLARPEPAWEDGTPVGEAPNG